MKKFISLILKRMLMVVLLSALLLQLSSSVAVADSEPTLQHDDTYDVQIGKPFSLLLDISTNGYFLGYSVTNLPPGITEKITPFGIQLSGTPILYGEYEIIIELKNVYATSTYNFFLNVADYSISWDSITAFTLGSTVSLIAKSNHSLATFQFATIDGFFLEANDAFLLTPGSTILELLPSYLNTLSPGTHTLTMQWAGTPPYIMSLDFTIIPASVPPQTGDSSLSPWLLLAIMAISGEGLFVLLRRRRLHKR